MIEEFFNGHTHQPSDSPLFTCTCEERGYRAASRAMERPTPMRMVSERMLYPVREFPAMDKRSSGGRRMKVNWFLVFLILLCLVTALLVTAAWPILGPVLT